VRGFIEYLPHACVDGRQYNPSFSRGALPMAVE
jgi:hypothetical protein